MGTASCFWAMRRSCYTVKDNKLWDRHSRLIIWGNNLDGGTLDKHTNESSEAEIGFFWHSGENFPLKALATFRMSFLTIWAPLARHQASESLLFASVNIPPMSCLKASMTSLPSGWAVTFGTASNTLSFRRVALVFFTLSSYLLEFALTKCH